MRGGEKSGVWGEAGESRIYTQNIPDITKCNKAVDTSIKVRRTKISRGEKAEQLPPPSSPLLPNEMNEKYTSGRGKQCLNSTSSAAAAAEEVLQEQEEEVQQELLRTDRQQRVQLTDQICVGAPSPLTPRPLLSL